MHRRHGRSKSVSEEERIDSSKTWGDFTRFESCRRWLGYCSGGKIASDIWNIKGARTKSEKNQKHQFLTNPGFRTTKRKTLIGDFFGIGRYFSNVKGKPISVFVSSEASFSTSIQIRPRQAGTHRRCCRQT